MANRQIVRVRSATEHLGELLQPGEAMLIEDVLRETGLKTEESMKTLMWRLRSSRGIDLHVKNGHLIRHK